MDCDGGNLRLAKGEARNSERSASPVIDGFTNVMEMKEPGKNNIVAPLLLIFDCLPVCF